MKSAMMRLRSPPLGGVKGRPRGARQPVVPDIKLATTVKSGGGRAGLTQACENSRIFERPRDCEYSQALAGTADALGGGVGKISVNLFEIAGQTRKNLARRVLCRGPRSLPNPTTV